MPGIFKGAPPTFSVEILVRAEIVRAWAESCSDRDLEWHLLSNLVVRWFVGLSLLAPVPDHTTLARFHAFLAIVDHWWRFVAMGAAAICM